MFQKDTSFQQALVNVNLTPLQRSILEKRYVELVNHFTRRCVFLSFFFHTSRIVVTVGSLIVPALLSIQYTEASPASQDTYSMSYQIYWITWVISLLVTTFNGVQSIFKLEKKYFSMHTSMEQLRSEGWQYIELSGRYSGFYTPNERPSHENQFIFFCASIEKIKMKQVEEEYWKINETGQDNSKEAAMKKNTLIPPTPYKPLQTTIDIHPEMSVKVIETLHEENISSAENKNEPEGNQQESKKSVSVPIVLSETTDAQ
jgi:hypothetical protein